jgi:hypothetical protein
MPSPLALAEELVSCGCDRTGVGRRAAALVMIRRSSSCSANRGRRASAPCSTASRRRLECSGLSATPRGESSTSASAMATRRSSARSACLQVPATATRCCRRFPACAAAAFAAYVAVCETGGPHIQEATYDTPLGDGPLAAQSRPGRRVRIAPALHRAAASRSSWTSSRRGWSPGTETACRSCRQHGPAWSCRRRR